MEDAWTKVKNFGMGAGVSAAKNIVIDPVLFAFGASEYLLTLGGDKYYSGLKMLEENAESKFVNDFVTDIQAYNMGKVAGDIWGMAVGIVETAAGIMTMVSGVTVTGGGALLTSTGVAAPEGAAVCVC